MTLLYHNENSLFHKIPEMISIIKTRMDGPGSVHIEGF